MQFDDLGQALEPKENWDEEQVIECSQCLYDIGQGDTHYLVGNEVLCDDCAIDYVVENMDIEMMEQYLVDENLWGMFFDEVFGYVDCDYSVASAMREFAEKWWAGCVELTDAMYNVPPSDKDKKRMLRFFIDEDWTSYFDWAVKKLGMKEKWEIN